MEEVVVNTVGGLQILKLNAIRIAQHHRAHCDGADCSISLYLLREMAEKAGVKFTEEEGKDFL